MVCYRLILALCLLKYSLGATTQSPKVSTITASAKSNQYPPGDHRNCPSGPKMLEVLPGLGWDGLTFQDTYPVLAMNFSQCLTTDDGKYLIPDSVYVMSNRESSLKGNAELFEDWRDYSSTTAPSMKDGSSISGSFSTAVEKAKKNQVVEKALTVRAEIRYGIYSIQVDSSATIHPTLKDRLNEIAKHIQNGEVRQSRYLAELLVRDYGTHYVTKIMSGGVIAREDAVKNTYVGELIEQGQQVTAIASEMLYHTLKLKSGESMHNISKEEMEKYSKNCVASEMTTYGGAQSLEDDFDYKNWSNNLMNYMTTIDRSGNPLHFIITAESVPEMPQPILQQLKTLIKEAVRLYINLNTHAGCTDLNSPSFSYLANVDDGSCSPPKNNYTFGGVYQTCEVSSDDNETKHFCDRKMQKNDLTGDFSCPENFTAVELYSDKVTFEYPVRKCYNSDDIFEFPYCKVVYKTVKVTYKAYWCAAKKEVEPNNGYLFGGLFTGFSTNLVTGTAGCPPNFYPLIIAEDLHVCVSNDYEKAAQYSIPFGGFFSCSAGNPLTKLKEVNCPEGYSKQLAAIYAGCEINYCIVTADIKRTDLPHLMQPPFSQKEEDVVNATTTLLIVDEAAGKVWFRSNGSESWIVATSEEQLDNAGLTDLFHGKNHTFNNHTDINNQTHSNGTANNDKGKEGMSPSTIAVIVICGAVAALISIAMAVFAYRKRSPRPRSESKANLHDNEAQGEPSEAQNGPNEPLNNHGDPQTSSSTNNTQETQPQATESES